MTNVIFTHKEEVKFVFYYNKALWEQLQFWCLY